MRDDLLDRRIRQLLAEVRETAPPADPWDLVERRELEMPTNHRWWFVAAAAAAIMLVVAVALVLVDDEPKRVTTVQPSVPIMTSSPTTTSPPSTTSPPPTTSANASESFASWERSEIAPIVPALTNLQVVAMTGEGADLARFSLDGGELLRIDVPPIQSPALNGEVIRLDGATLVGNWGAASNAYIVDDTGVIRPAPPGISELPLFPGDVPGTMWVSTILNQGAGPIQLDLVNAEIFGPDVAPTFGVINTIMLGPSQTPLGEDPLGGLLVADYSTTETYLADHDGLRLLTDGLVWGIGEHHIILEHDCVDAASCQFTLVDRDTGKRQPFVLPQGLQPSPNQLNNWTGPATIAPDGHSIVACVQSDADDGASNRERRLYVDLATGASIAIDNCLRTVDDSAYDTVWTDDGKYLVLIMNGRLRVIDRADSTMLPADPALPMIVQFSRVPAP